MALWSFKRRWLVLGICLAFIVLGFAIPEHKHMPVEDASSKDWHPQSFWFEPWGSSGVHKGIDIFASKGKTVRSTTAGIVLYQGELAKGGKVVAVLGPKWRLHYFAHLNSIDTHGGAWLSGGDTIGTVGDTGNAQGKPPHLHYSIVNLVPRPWAMDSSTQGHKKAVFENPALYLSGSLASKSP